MIEQEATVGVVNETSKTPKKGALEEQLYTEKLSSGAMLHVAPRVVVSWDEFIKTAPPYSVALDGIVYGKPQFDKTGPFTNFNHHEEVNRLATRSTCAQVLLYLKQEFIDSYTKDGMPEMNIFVNDSDQDASLSVWLLNNYERVLGTKSEPLINKIVDTSDRLDATAGAYPYDLNTQMMRELNWVFEPFTQAKVEARVPQMNGGELANVISSVGERISRYTLGKAEQLALDTEFERLGGGANWTLVNEIGIAARSGLYHAGIKAFVSVKERADGAFTYSIGKMSPFVDWPVTDFFHVLNVAEGLKDGTSNSWGGSDIIGGSPRETGSTLTPKEVETIINSLCSKPS